MQIMAAFNEVKMICVGYIKGILRQKINVTFVNVEIFETKFTTTEIFVNVNFIQSHSFIVYC